MFFILGDTVQMFKIQIMHLLSIKLLKKHLKSAAWFLLTGGDYITATVNLLSNDTLFITKNSSLCANETSKGYESKKAILYAENCKNIS